MNALVDRRAGGRTNAAGGGWGIFAGENKNDTPLNTQLPLPQASIDESEEASSFTKTVVGMKRRRVDGEDVIKSRKLIAQGRFGDAAKYNDGNGVERFDVRIEDPFPFTPVTRANDLASDEETEAAGTTVEPNTTSKKRKGRRSMIDLALERDYDEEIQEESGGSWKPDVRVTFHGLHIFAGIRELAELGVVDGEKMPGWMTGEDGVTVGVVKDGRIKGYKGNGS